MLCKTAEILVTLGTFDSRYLGQRASSDSIGLARFSQDVDKVGVG